MMAACKKIQAGEKASKLDCYGGQLQKYEGLTVNFAEAVTSAGGVITDPDGKPAVNNPEVKKALQLLVDSSTTAPSPRQP